MVQGSYRAVERSARVISPPLEALASLRQPLTAGEWKVFEFFDRHLDPAWEIYIQPHLNGLRPDFVLLNPHVGLAVFEVKDWDLSAMHYGVEERAGRPPLLWAEDQGRRFSLQPQNPVEKVLLYRQEIFNLYCPRLKQGGGFAAVTAGIIFPFSPEREVLDLFTKSLQYRGIDKYSDSYCPVVGLESIERGDLAKVFPGGLRRTSRFMSPIQAMDLRNWLVEPDASATQRQPLDLDKVQMGYVKSRTQSGYRRIRGPAGSGKSLVLAARAAELIAQGKKVLVVTFNITLLHYLMDVAVRYPGAKGRTRRDVTWLNFHAWCRRICQQNDAFEQYGALWKREDQEKVLNEDLPKLVLGILSRLDPDKPERVEIYDAVLVDEGQDFLPGWWSALRAVCKPGGEMLLVADVSQDIYGRATSWTDEAMTGAGFSGKWAELEVSYRMPATALELASKFAQRYLPSDLRILPRLPQAEMTLEPCYPRWVQYNGQDSAGVCCDEVLGLFRRAGSAGLSMADVTFLCDHKGLGLRVVEELVNRGIRCVHTYSADEKECRRQKMGFYMGDARVKATTLHSFKGWEARILVLYVERGDSPEALALIYAGLTRIKRHPEGSFLTVISKAPELRSFGCEWPDFVEIE